MNQHIELLHLMLLLLMYLGLQQIRHYHLDLNKILDYQLKHIITEHKLTTPTRGININVVSIKTERRCFSCISYNPI